MATRKPEIVSIWARSTPKVPSVRQPDSEAEDFTPVPVALGAAKDFKGSRISEIFLETSFVAVQVAVLEAVLGAVLEAALVGGRALAATDASKWVARTCVTN